jgi:hypothetical protein
MAEYKQVTIDAKLQFDRLQRGWSRVHGSGDRSHYLSRAK